MSDSVKHGLSPAGTIVRNVITTMDAAKIRKDAETAIENGLKSANNAEFMQVWHGSPGLAIMAKNRYILLSRRNSLFFGFHKVAERGAMFYSLSCSCHLQDINFFKYISEVINIAASLPPELQSVNTKTCYLPDGN